MRVLMVTTDHLVIDRRILQEAESLQQAGYRVELLAGFECAEPSAYERAGVPITRFAYDWSDTRIQALLAPLAPLPGPARTWAWRGARFTVAMLTGLTSFEHYVLRHI